MIRNYVITAWRSLQRNKIYALINIVGLAIGVASCLLIFLIAEFETGFDNFYLQKNQIYGVITTSMSADRLTFDSGTPLPMSSGQRMDFPQLADVAAIMKNDGSHYSVANSGGGNMEPQFFNMFNFRCLAGNKNKALSDPGTVLLRITVGYNAITAAMVNPVKS